MVDGAADERAAAGRSTSGARASRWRGAGCGKTTVLTERFLVDDEGDRSLAIPRGPDLHREGGPRAAAADPPPLPRPDRVGGGSRAWRWVLARPRGGADRHVPRVLREWLRGRAPSRPGSTPSSRPRRLDRRHAPRPRPVRTASGGLLAERDPDLIDLAVDYGLGQIREALGHLVDPARSATSTSGASLSAEEIVDRWKAAWEREGPARRLDMVGPGRAECREFLLEHEPTIPRCGSGGSPCSSSSP